MRNFTYDNTLILDKKKYLISKRLYQELLAQTNLIKDYLKCRSYVITAVYRCANEVMEVAEFKTKKIDIEI